VYWKVRVTVSLSLYIYSLTVFHLAYVNFLLVYS